MKYRFLRLSYVFAALLWLLFFLPHFSYALQLPPAERAGLQIALTASEKAWLREHPVLRLGIDPNFEPIEFINHQGEYKGISAQFMQRISDVLDIELSYDPKLSWQQVMQQAESGDIDVLPAITPSQQRARFLSFTPPYMSSPLMLFTRNNAPLITSLEDLGNRLVAVERSYIAQDYLQQQHPHVRLHWVDTSAQALQALSSGQVDAYVGNLTLGSYLIDKLGLSNLKVAAPTPYVNNLAIGVRKDAPLLLSILNKALASIDDDQRRAIRQAALGIRYEVRVDYALVWQILAVVGVVLLLLSLWMLQIQRQKRALAVSQQRLELALQGGDLGSWDVDLRTHETTVNARWAEMLGYEWEDIEDPYALWLASIHPDDKELVHDIGHLVQIGELEHYSVQYRIVNRAGQVRWMLSKGMVVEYNAKKMPLRMVGTVMDVTEQEETTQVLAEAKAEAEQASRFKSHFLANMSHEIRTPMNAIIGFSHLALQTDLTPRQNQYLEKIQHSAKALLGVINDILDFSKIEAGKLHVEKIHFSLEAVLEDLANLTVMKAEEKGIEMLIHRDLQVPDGLVGDPLRLGQVLINLVSNAIKFTEQGEVTVSVTIQEVEETCLWLHFAVQDTGIGIPADKIEPLFSSFTQLDDTTTRRHGGTGLGLSISQQLVHLMGGKMCVESTEGKGSCFSFNLPFQVHAKDLQRNWTPAPDLRGTRVLVVDDNPSALKILSSLLQSFTFDVSTADCSEAALDLLEASKTNGQPFQLVLMDWRLPDVNGVETGQKIKQDKSLPITPAVILVTAYGREEVMQQAEKAGFDGFLIKPVTPSTLFDTIMRTLSDDAQAPLQRPVLAQKRPLQRLKGRLLLVEDNSINQQVAQELLETVGLQVVIADNGIKALDKLQQHAFDLVLMDIQMPEMDGYEATRQLRAQPQFKDLPVIAMTAHAMVGDRDKCLAAGMNDHVAKPIDPYVLFETLSRYLEVSDAPVASNPQAQKQNLPALPARLPGIDVQWGLERVGGNQKLFQKLLKEFMDNHGNAMQLFADYFAQGDLDSARREAHTLQGVAGSMGATALQKQARQLENAIVNGSVCRSEQIAPEFVQSFAQLMDSLQQLLASQAEHEQQTVQQGANSMGAAALQKALQDLQTLLAEGDPEAGELVRKLTALDLPAEQLKVLQTIEQLIDDYDFDSASELLRR